MYEGRIIGKRKIGNPRKSWKNGIKMAVEKRGIQWSASQDWHKTGRDGRKFGEDPGDTKSHWPYTDR